MDAASVKPSRAYYLLAVLLLLACAGACVASVFVIVRMVDVIIPMVDVRSDQIVVPGSGQFRLDKPGDYVVAYESRSVVKGRAFCTQDDVPPLSCQVVCLPARQAVTLGPTRGSYTYSFGPRSGQAVWSFHANRAGPYELSAAYLPGVRNTEQVVLAVVPELPWRKLLGWLALGVGACLCGVGAVIVFLLTLIRRSSAKGRLAQAAVIPPPTRPPAAP